MSRITRANLREYIDKIETQMQLMEETLESNGQEKQIQDEDAANKINCMAYDWACKNMIQGSWLVEAFTVYATLNICPAQPPDAYLVSYCVDSPLWAHTAASEADFAHFVRCVT